MIILIKSFRFWKHSSLHMCYWVFVDHDLLALGVIRDLYA